MKEIEVHGPGEPWGHWERKAAAAEVILAEIEMWGRACFEQKHISQEWLDGLQEFLLEQRGLLGKRTSKHVIERADVDGVFARACETYALLWNELSGKNRHAKIGYKTLDGSHRSHGRYHGATAGKEKRQKEVRTEFIELRKKRDSNGKPPTKNACYMRLAGKHGRKTGTIKRDCRGL